MHIHKDKMNNWASERDIDERKFYTSLVFFSAFYQFQNRLWHFKFCYAHKYECWVVGIVEHGGGVSTRCRFPWGIENCKDFSSIGIALPGTPCQVPPYAQGPTKGGPLTCPFILFKCGSPLSFFREKDTNSTLFIRDTNMIIILNDVLIFLFCCLSLATKLSPHIIIWQSFFIHHGNFCE